MPQLRTLEEVQEECLSLLNEEKSIRICLGILFEWRNIDQQKLVYTQETLPAVTLDEDELETGEWALTWSTIDEQLRAIAEHNTIVSGLSLERVVRIKLNWVRFQERSSRQENNAAGVDDRARTWAEQGQLANIEHRSIAEPAFRYNGLLFVHLLYVSYRVYIGTSLPSLRRMEGRSFQEFLRRFSLESLRTVTANLSNISDICANLYYCTLHIYNKRNNVIFAHEVENAQFKVLLYWNGSRLLVIKNLNRFLNKRRAIGTLCTECRKVHKEGEACDQRNLILGQFEKPYNRDGLELCLSFYCDIEAMCPNNENQIACCFSLVSNYDGGEIVHIDEQIIAPEDKISETAEAEIQLIAALFKKIEERIGEFFEWNDNGRTPVWQQTQCTWCAEEKFCCRLRRVLIATANKQIDYVCTMCQAKNSNKYEPVVFFHNFSKYDICFVLRHLVQNYQLQIAGRSTELIYNINCKRNKLLNFKIRDSLHFISGSIAAFSQQVPARKWEANEQFAPYFALFEGAKGEFAYEWLQSREQLFRPFPVEGDVNTQRNRLTNQQVYLSDLQEICDRFELANVGVYLNKYCTVDVLILMFYFDEFRTSMFKEFSVDVALFYSISSVSWYLAMRNEDKCQTPNSIEDYILIRDNIRGGVSQCVLRAAEVGKEGVQHLRMLDVNALYSWCMTQHLPTEFIETITIMRHDTTNWLHKLQHKDAHETWLCCVDLEYPEELHLLDAHFYFPLAPHRYNNRLCTTFLPKYEYLVLDELLLFYVEKGLTIIKWHSIQRWRNATLFKDFILQNINVRNKSTDPAIKNARKIANNSLYGKTCENVFRYRQFIVDRIEEAPASVDAAINRSAARWLNFTTIDAQYVIAEVARKEVILNKPVQLGFAILEFAKLRIYQFWHALCMQFGNDVLLMYTDTDSLLLGFRFAEDPFVLMRNSSLLSTFVDLPIDTMGNALPPSKQIGLFSDELHDRHITGYIGLKAKSYIIRFADNTYKKRMKGVRISALFNNRPLTFEDFEHALFKHEQKRVAEYSLRKKRFSVRLIKTDKLALDSYDAKHQYTSNVVEAIPWGFDLSKLPP